MSHPDYIPADYKRIKVVDNLSELFSEQFGGADGVNCVLFPRPLSHDFNALARWLEGTRCNSFDSVRLRFSVKNAKPGIKAVAEAILTDMDTVHKEQMRNCELRLVRADRYRPGTVDVWHHDVVGSFNSMMGRFMCCYNAPVTEGVRNEDAVPVVYESACAPVNHYSQRDRAEIFSFRPGDLWRQLSTPYLKDVAPPYIHRAPAQGVGDAPRLLLIASY